jgi:hypothetical protein
MSLLPALVLLVDFLIAGALHVSLLQVPVYA